MTVSLPRKFASFGAIFAILLPKVAEAGRESLLAKDDSVHVPRPIAASIPVWSTKFSFDP